MAATDQSQSILNALAEAGAQNPELQHYYEFHRLLLRMLDEARAVLSDDQHSGVLEPCSSEAGSDPEPECRSPLLTFEHLPLEGVRFVGLVSAVARVLRDYDPAFEAQDVPDSSADCLHLARKRFEEGKACHRQGVLEEPATLAQLSVDLALRPYLEWGAEQLASYVEVRAAWRQGYCPICGGPPDFASLDEESGARQLLCSRCSTRWPYPRLGCPFCGTADHASLSYYPGDDGAHRLYVCQDCRRYLKTIDLRQVRRVILWPLERITTVAMDAAALEVGYR